MTPPHTRPTAASHPQGPVAFVKELSQVLGRTEAATRRAILRGDCGPYIRMGRRLAVLRESFLEHLRAQQEFPEPDPQAMTPGDADAKTVDALTRKDVR